MIISVKKIKSKQYIKSKNQIQIEISKAKYIFVSWHFWQFIQLLRNTVEEN